jgi:hypothetical protein
MNLVHPLDETRSVTYTIVLGVWAVVAVYAVLHDQYIVRIAPEHFTAYHRPLWGIEEPNRLAAAHAFLASFSPGLLLGIACAFAARVGSLPKLSIRFVLLGVVGVVAVTELLSATTGYCVYRTQQPLYPPRCYPDHSLPMLVTQTIQISCYVASALFSGLFLLQIVRTRFRRAHKMPNKAGGDR